MLPLAHIAGIPVEETLASFLPFGMVLLAATRQTVARRRRTGGRLRGRDRN